MIDCDKKNVRQLMLYDSWIRILQFSSLNLNIFNARLHHSYCSIPMNNQIFNFCHQQWIKSKYRIFRHSRFHYMIWMFSFQPQKSTFTIEICNIRFEILISNEEMDKNETLYSHDQQKKLTVKLPCSWPFTKRNRSNRLVSTTEHNFIAKYSVIDMFRYDKNGFAFV